MFGFGVETEFIGVKFFLVRPRSREVQSPKVYKGSYQVIQQQPKVTVVPSKEAQDNSTSIKSSSTILPKQVNDYFPNVAAKMKNINNFIRSTSRKGGHDENKNIKRYGERAIQPKSLIIRTSIE